MAYPVSLQQLRVRVRQRCGLEGATGFVTDEELTDMLNQSITDWYDLIRTTTFGGQYYRKKSTITVSPGGGVGGSSTLFPLPFNFLAMISVDINATGSSKPWSGRPYQEEDRNSLNYPAITTGWFGPLVWYQLQDVNINFLSVPTASYAVTLNFVPTAPLLAQPSDTLDSINGFEELIVLKAAQKALFKDGRLDYVAALGPFVAEQTDRIRSAVSERDQGAAETVHDLVGNTAMGYGFTGQGEGWP